MPLFPRQAIDSLYQSAERRIGEFSWELPRTDNNTRFGSRTPHDGEPDTTKTSILKSVGITHSERYEAIASLPDKVFEKELLTRTFHFITLSKVLL